MAISVVANSLQRSSAGSKIRVRCQVVYTTYQTGGPFLAANQFGLDQVEIANIEQAGGFQLDPVVAANGTGINFKAFSGSGGGTATLVTTQDEVVAVALNTGPLAATPALVQNVTVTATGAGPLGPYSIIAASVVPISGQVSVDVVTGNLTFAAADMVSSATVTYLLPSAAVGGGGSGQVANGTNLAGIGNINLEVIGL